MSSSIDNMLADVSIGAPWDLTEIFSALPRCSPQDVNRACDVLVSKLRLHGIPVQVHDCDLYLSVPLSAHVVAQGRTFKAKPSAYSIHCPRGLTGDLVYVPASYSRSISSLFLRNFDAQATSADRLRGKIVVSEGFATPQKMREFEENGAIGVIAVNPGIDIHWGICTTIWGSPGLDDLKRKPNIPILAVNQTDGLQLIDLAKHNDAATLVCEMDEGWFQQKLPLVTITGAQEPDPFVLLHGHYDSWDVGVGDNATGNATMLEIARVLWLHRAKLKRSVHIAWWPGHSTGRYAGSTWYADHFALELDEYCVAQINCDSPGCRWATEYHDISWMKEAEAFAQSVIRKVTGQEAMGARPHRAGDYSFNNIGITSLMMLSSTMPEPLREEKGYYSVGGCGGNIAWHTENDRLEIADPEVMLKDIKVYLSLVAGIANAEILPFDWRMIVDELKDVLAKYQQEMGNDYVFSNTRQALSQLEETLRLFHVRLSQAALSPAVANAVITRLARLLVPINHTQQARFGHDPASPVPALPTISIAAQFKKMDPGLRGFALTQLRRGENRLVATLKQAHKEVLPAIA